MGLKGFDAGEAAKLNDLFGKEADKIMSLINNLNQMGATQGDGQGQPSVKGAPGAAIDIIK